MPTDGTKKLEAKKKAKALPNPFFDYRNAWISREAAARSRERMWQIVALMGLLASLFALAGLIYYANNSKYIPYVVEVDKLGAAMGVKPADKMKRVDVRVVRYSVANFIAEARMVSPDVNVQKRAIFRVYAFLNKEDVAFQKMNEFLNSSPETTPFARARKMTVETEILSVIPQTNTSWEIDWYEITRNRSNGQILNKERMRGIISVYFAAADKTQKHESLLYNPLGLFVKDFNWSVVQESSVKE